MIRILIYFFAGHNKYGPISKKIMYEIEQGKIKGIISPVTFMEILVGPYRQDNEELVNNYYSLISMFPNLEIKEFTFEIADEAARIRASYNTPAPDSILLATALQSNADLFITNDNDRDLIRFSEIQIILLNDLLA